MPTIQKYYRARVGTNHIIGKKQGKKFLSQKKKNGYEGKQSKRKEKEFSINAVLYGKCNKMIFIFKKGKT